MNNIKKEINRITITTTKTKTNNKAVTNLCRLKWMQVLTVSKGHILPEEFQNYSPAAHNKSYSAKSGTARRSQLANPKITRHLKFGSKLKYFTN